MKSKIILLIISTLITCVLNAQVVTEKKTGWDYPVKPGTEEWKKFESNEDMVAACQIPEKILTSLSTEDLTDLCLRYPLLYDVFAFNNTNEGVDKLFRDFNGIRELYKRKEVTSELLKQYDGKMCNLSFLDEKKSDVEKGLYIISISALEVLLCRYEAQNDTSKEILRNLVAGYENKLKYADYFKGFGFRTNVYSRANVIYKMSTQNKELLSGKNTTSVRYSGMADAETMRLLDDLSYQLIK